MTPHSPLTNRSILCTGGTGSFGVAFVRHALDVGARRVAILSRDELKQFNMRAAFQDDRLRFFVGDVRNSDRVERAMRGVDIVVHAAALKQIPTCEDNPSEAKATNIDGTENVALAAIEAGVWRGVFLSTDKAANPNTTYGACKLVAERLWNQANVYAAGTRTRLCATRYGNVIGSRGSVIPLFRQQAADGGPLTVTDPTMTRYWMRLEESVALVETALTYSRGGEVYVPHLPASDMATVAEAVAPGVDTTVTGIRRGEKLHETLITEDEARNALNHGTFYTIEPNRTWEHLPEPAGDPLPAGFVYRSDTAKQLDAVALRQLILLGHTEENKW